MSGDNPQPTRDAGAMIDYDDRRKRARRPALPMMGLNVAPMIDVVFLLLMYFMLITEFRAPEGSMPLNIAGQAAEAADPFALPEAPITIVVESLGQGRADALWRADSPILGTGSGFASLTDAAFAQRGGVLAPSQRFDIRPAPGCRWEHAVATVNALRLARYEQVRLTEEGG